MIPHVDWWLRNGHTTPEYVSSGVVQTMFLQHYFFRLSRCWRTWSWNANRHRLTGWYNQQQRVSSQCFMYTSLGCMYTSWWWFRLIVTIMGERNVYTKDAQQVHVIGLNHIFRCWWPQRWSVVQLVTLVFTFHCYVMGWLIVTIRGERMCTSRTHNRFTWSGLNIQGWIHTIDDQWFNLLLWCYTKDWRRSSRQSILHSLLCVIVSCVRCGLMGYM